MYDEYMTAIKLKVKPSPKKVALWAEQFKALGDPVRLNLVLQVDASPDNDACVCDLTPATGVGQSTVSHHLKVLVEAGLLQREQRGKWAHYSLTPTAIALLRYLA
jgi:ArsR family transcriptional regulator